MVRTRLGRSYAQEGRTAMNIVVCVKHVPDATADRTFDSSDNTVDRAGVDGLLSELDEYAVEEALKIVEGSDGEVTVLTVGPSDAGDALRKSLQMGAHKAVHVEDDAIAGSDALATSLILAEAIKKIDHDLVICGVASTDGSMGVVPQMVAERLGVPAVTQASEVSVDGGTVTIRRDGDAASETVEASGNVVVSVTDQINEPRYPSFKGIMAAKKKPVTSYTLADLGIAAEEVGLSAAWSMVREVSPRPPRMQGEVIIDEGDGGTRLVEFLASQRLV